MSVDRNNSLRIALLAEQDERDRFGVLFEGRDVELVFDQHYDALLPQSLNGAQVLLVSVRSQSDRPHIERILRESPVPVLINTGAASDGEVAPRRVLARLRALVQCSSQNAAARVQRARPELCLVHVEPSDQGVAKQIIVLGASVGGPVAVARFLRDLPSNLPVAFLLAQHISESSQNLLVQQLDRCSEWRVAMPGSSERLEPGQVWMVPAGIALEMHSSDLIRCRRHGWASISRPDIDHVLRDVARVFGARAGAIMFSGSGDDGARGCAVIKEAGGFVWAQDSESCAMANMPEAARRACAVEFSGTPENLARELISRCRLESTSIN